MITHLSGTQVQLSHENLTATIASVGASVREYRYQERDLTLPFHSDEIRPMYRGATLAPWPNRIVDGSYSFEGVPYQLPLNEIERQHALHGLTPWLNFSVLEHNENTALLAATIEPQSGYPWRIRIHCRFTLNQHGLTQTVTATNLSAQTAPYGLCPHPYLVAGAGKANDWLLQLPAERVFTVTQPRLIPDRLLPVEHEATRFDFRRLRSIQDTVLDHAFTGLSRNAHHRTEVRLLTTSGTGVGMSWGPELAWVQVYTSDTAQDSPSTVLSHRNSVAIEPMTCAPNAFRLGTEFGLVLLAPQETHTASWTIYPIHSN